MPIIRNQKESVSAIPKSSQHNIITYKLYHITEYPNTTKVLILLNDEFKKKKDRESEHKCYVGCNRSI